MWSWAFIRALDDKGLGEGMKITLNAIQYKHNSSGIGKLIYNLFNALVSEISINKLDIKLDVIVTKDSPKLYACDYDFVNFIEIPFAKEQYVKRNIYELLFLYKLVDRNCDVFISMDSKLPLIMHKGVKKILTVTDMAVYRMGEVYQFSRALYWKALFNHSIRNSDKVVSISRFTKNEIIDITGVKEDKISVVYCGVNNSFRYIDDKEQIQSIREKYGLTEPFILFVGTFSPRKNLLRLLKAYELLQNRYGVMHKLVIVGEKGWKFNKETALLQKSSIVGNIIFPGYIQDEDLPAVYNAADVTVYPSIYEGFGLPVVESMACGTPVALSDIPCLMEVAGDAAVYFDPLNVEDMADSIYSLLSDSSLYDEIKARGMERAKRYSWKEAAHAFLEIIQGMHAQGGRPV